MKRAYYLLLAIPILLMSMRCEDDYGTGTIACIFRNVSQDTLTVVVSEEYPDTLFPYYKMALYKNILPGGLQGIQVNSYDWNDNQDYVLQLFVYDHSVPHFAAYLREKHVELFRYQLTKKEIKAMGGIVVYPPQHYINTEQP